MYFGCCLGWLALAAFVQEAAAVEAGLAGTAEGHIVAGIAAGRIVFAAGRIAAVVAPVAVRALVVGAAA